MIIAAAANSAEAWLNARIALDEQSSEDWRRKRAVVLRGMFDHPPVDELTWSAGAPVEGWAAIRRNAVRWRSSHALSRHWWRTFLAAATPEAAYAAWTVFLMCVDRRAWIWMDKDIPAHADGTALWRLKMLHYSLNRPALDRAMEQKEKHAVQRLDAYLMGWKSPQAWLNLSAIADG